MNDYVNRGLNMSKTSSFSWFKHMSTAVTSTSGHCDLKQKEFLLHICPTHV